MKKKHPVLTVILIIFAIGIFLGGVASLFLSLLGPSSHLAFGEKIGVIPIQGIISDSFFITSQIEKFKNDDDIKAIILRINSPGGAVAPTQEIFREVRKTVKLKKVIVSMGEVAASGGYYIAAAANKIVANPATITGSIGVIMHFMRIEELLNKIGIVFEVIKSGEFKDTGSPYRKLTKSDRALLTGLMVEIKRQFVADVAEGRNLPAEDVLKIADGRIILGIQARDLGLVDVLGNFQDAVALAKNLSGIKEEVKLVYPKKDRPGFLDMFMKSAVRSFINSLHDVSGQVEFRWDGLT
jgi:protease-4